MRKMHNPPHPGLIIKEDILPALGISVTEAAESLGVTRAAFSRVINGKAAISPEMAIRIEKWLGITLGVILGVIICATVAYYVWKYTFKNYLHAQKLYNNPISAASLSVKLPSVPTICPPATK